MFTIAESMLPEAEDTSREFGDSVLLEEVLAKRTEIFLDRDQYSDLLQIWDELAGLDQGDSDRRHLHILQLKIRIALKKMELTREPGPTPEKELREFNFLGSKLGLAWVPTVYQYFNAHFAFVNGDLVRASQLIDSALEALPPKEMLPHPYLPWLFWVGYQASLGLGDQSRAQDLLKGGSDLVNRLISGIEDEEVRQSCAKNLHIHRMILQAQEAKAG
jgi:hypothetical protein